MESYARQKSFDIVLHLQAVSHHQDLENFWELKQMICL